MDYSPTLGDDVFDATIVPCDRLCEIDLHLTRSQLQQLTSVVRQEQFPALVHLRLEVAHSYPAVALPDGFLGGSAPRLQSLELRRVPFPALPNLLLSVTDLVHLVLRNIPHSGYISPEAIVTGLAVLANLKYLIISFEPPYRESRSPPTSVPTRTFLPALTHFEFNGVNEYLEDLVARIDAPLLDSIWINFCCRPTFDIPQLAQFMRRTTGIQALNEAHVDLGLDRVEVRSLPPMRTFDEKARLRISCTQTYWHRVSSMAPVFTLPCIPMVEHLYIYGPRDLPPQWQDALWNIQWLEVLRPFPALKNLYISREFARSIATDLQELVRGRETDVLPALESLFLEELQPSGPIQEDVGKFVAARQLSGHPVTVSLWERDSERD